MSDRSGGHGGTVLRVHRDSGSGLAEGLAVDARLNRLLRNAVRLSYDRTTREARVVKTLIGGVTVLTVFAFAEISVKKSDTDAETRAISALRAVSSAQQHYAQTNGGYAQSLGTLARPCTGSSYGFVSPHLGTDPVVVNGYEIRLHAMPHGADRHLDCHSVPTAAAYYATAIPVQRDRGAMRAFAVDQAATIWYDATGTAPTPPFHDTATVRQLRESKTSRALGDRRQRTDVPPGLIDPIRHR